MRKVKVGIVGCGNISEIYMRNIKTFFNNLEIVGCADLEQARADEKAKVYGIKSIPLEELYVREDIEIILNLTIPAAHFDVSLRSLKNGKHVYSEKPLGITRDEGAALVQLANQKGLLLGCAPDTFLGAGLQTCRKLLDDGWIGTPISALGFMIKNGPESFHPNPEFFYQQGGGPMMDMGPYYITAMVTLLGPVIQVCGMTQTPTDTKTISGPFRTGHTFPVETPSTIYGTLKFAQGAYAQLVTSFDSHQSCADSRLPLLTVFGSEGTISLPDPNYFSGPVQVRRFGGEPLPVPLTHGYSENSRGLGLSDMAEAIIKRRKHRANADLAFHVLDTILAFYDSAEAERHITVESTCERPEPLSRVWPRTCQYSLEKE